MPLVEGFSADFSIYTICVIFSLVSAKVNMYNFTGVKMYNRLP